MRQRIDKLSASGTLPLPHKGYVHVGVIARIVIVPAAWRRFAVKSAEAPKVRRYSWRQSASVTTHSGDVTLDKHRLARGLFVVTEANERHSNLQAFLVPARPVVMHANFSRRGRRL